MSAQYTFKNPILTVAIIGAGPSGVPAARHLLEAGFNVRLFERQPSAGGIWSFSPDQPLPTSHPSAPASVGDFKPVLPADGNVPQETILHDADGRERAAFSPPNPVYNNLNNNIPTPTLEFKDFPYPKDTPWYVDHSTMASYVRDYAVAFHVDDITSFNTRVERVHKIGARWQLTMRKIEDIGDERVKETFWTEDFDSVVVATGHYGAPFIPYFKGAKEWAERWPDKIIHSRAYRKPETYKHQTVLIVGTGTSGVDIARDLSTQAKKIYQVTRNKLYGPKQYRAQRTLQRLFLPANGVHVSEIKAFLPIEEGTVEVSQAGVELTDGRILRGIDQVIFSTGYQYSYPFLRDYHRDVGTAIPSSGTRSENEVLVTDGDSVHNLYRDVFYIPDPTLTFIGVSINTATFSFFEYQAISIARVFSGKARLPSLEGCRAEYRAQVSERGNGKFLHLLGKEGEIKYVQETVEWLNREAEVYGVEKIEGHSQAWHEVSRQTLPMMAKRNGINLDVITNIIANLDAPIEAAKDVTTVILPAPIAVE